MQTCVTYLFCPVLSVFSSLLLQSFWPCWATLWRKSHISIYRWKPCLRSVTVCPVQSISSTMTKTTSWSEPAALHNCTSENAGVLKCAAIWHEYFGDYVSVNTKWNCFFYSRNLSTFLWLIVLQVYTQQKYGIVSTFRVVLAFFFLIRHSHMKKLSTTWWSNSLYNYL